MAIASSGGRPKPSTSDGKARQRQSDSERGELGVADPPEPLGAPRARPGRRRRPAGRRCPTTTTRRPARASRSASPTIRPAFLCGAGLPMTTMLPGPAAARVAAECAGAHRSGVLVAVRGEHDLAAPADAVALDLARRIARHRADRHGGAPEHRQQHPVEPPERRGVALGAGPGVEVVDADDLPRVQDRPGVAEAEEAARRVRGQHRLLPGVALEPADPAHPDRVERDRGGVGGKQELDLEPARPRGIVGEQTVERAHDLARVALHAGRRLRQKAPVDRPVPHPSPTCPPQRAARGGHGHVRLWVDRRWAGLIPMARAAGGRTSNVGRLPAPPPC